MNSAKTNILEHRPRLVLVFSFLGVNCWVKGWSAFYNLEILSFPPGPCQFPVHQPSWVISPHAPHHWILPGLAHLTSRTWLLVFIWIPLLVRLSIFCSGFVILFVILPRWFDVLCSLFIFLIPFLFRLEKWRQRSPNYRKNCLNKKRSCKTPWSFCSWASTRKKSSLISVSERLGGGRRVDHFLPLRTKKPALDYPLRSSGRLSSRLLCMGFLSCFILLTHTDNGFT